ncbi:MAG: rhomboid family intramembrane serine protease [Chitinophagales bacterium]
MSITIIIIIITALVSFGAFQSNELEQRLILRPYLINRDNQWYRFITSGFIHANIPHLAINMLVLYSFGRVVEYYYQAAFGDLGEAYFIAMYTGGIIVSDLPTYFKHRNNPSYASLGASGAVSSVLFASIFFNPWSQVMLFFIPMPGIVMGVLYLIYSAYMSRKSDDNINHDAHFYGAVFGVLFTLALQPRLGLHFIEQLMQPHF